MQGDSDGPPPVRAIEEMQQTILDHVRVQYAIPVADDLLGAEEILANALRDVLPPEQIGDVLAAAQRAAWAKCATGWIPAQKALNLIEQFGNFPLRKVQPTIGFVGGVDYAGQRDFYVERALEDGVDYVFSQDWDVLATADAFPSLLMCEQDIIGGVYFTKRLPSAPLIGLGADKQFFTAWYPREKQFSQWECELVGAGCLLVKADVFRNIEPPWFHDATGYIDGRGYTYTDDVHFCKKALAAGYKIHANTAVVCDHFDIHTGIVYGFDEETRKPAVRKLGLAEWKDPVPTERSLEEGRALMEAEPDGSDHAVDFEGKATETAC